MSNNNDVFSLYNISDATLNTILNLSDEELTKYIHQLIEKFYPDHMSDDKMYSDLVVGYKSSFIIEKIYRDNLGFQSGFQAIYTKTGLIRDIINDLYYNEDHLVTH